MRQVGQYEQGLLTLLFDRLERRVELLDLLRATAVRLLKGGGGAPAKGPR